MVETENPSIRKFLFGSVSRKIAVLFFICFILTFIAASSFYVYNFNDSLNKQISNQMESIFDLRSSLTMSLFDQYRERSDFVASKLGMKMLFRDYLSTKDPQILNDLLDNLNQTVDASPDLHSITLIDKDGFGVVSTHPNRTGRDYSDRDFFLLAKNQTYLSGLVNDGHGGFSVFVSSPLFINGDFLGVALVSSSGNELISAFNSTFGIGSKGDLYLINSDFYRITPSREFGEQVILKEKVETENARDCFDHKDEFYENGTIQHLELTEYQNENNQTLVGGHFYFHDEDICLILELNKEEIFLIPFYNLLKDSSLIFFGVLMIVIFISWLLSIWISKPFSELTDAITRLKKGNFKTKIDLKTGDEFELLADVLNDTMGELSHSEEGRKQIDKAKTEFISITSHELRSPMTPMRAQLQMLLRGYFGHLSPRQKSSLDIVLRNTERLDNIIVDFLEVSRIEAARLKFNFVKTNINDHIARLVKEMQGFMPEKKIKIIAKLKKVPVVEIDPDRVMQVMRNLINNAIKFSPEGKTIEVTSQLKDGKLLFTVKDQGIGIADKYKERIFEPFFQIEQTIYREHGGTGLGLPICRGIVSSQGGKIWLDSEAGRGTTFYFTFPLKPVREIKPIKLLFSNQEQIESELKIIFNETFGPISEKEFEQFKNTDQLRKENLFKYINSLYRKGVINESQKDLFKTKVAILFGERYISSKDVSKKLKRWVDKF